MEVFKDYAYYYNAFYHDKNYKEEVAQVDWVLKKYGNNIKKIINFGCGTGKHDMELSRLGYQCTGIDMSPLMIDIAKENACKEGMKIDFEVANICTYYSDKQYDAVVSLFHVMSYQNSNKDILSALQSARNVLTQGGLLVFDGWYGPGVLSDKPSVRVKEVDDNENRLIRIARPVMHDKKNTVDVYYEVLVINKATGETGEIKEVHKMRYFFRPELELMLEQSGFELIENLDCRTLNDTDYDSWTSFFIARAI
ncbi:MAG: class I SAM-dependent methyltransferase [Lachnospiraceae bacterium]|nr:class I SAM-dependent methyltransferase [Lachnospiraceae bacterium]